MICFFRNGRIYGVPTDDLEELHPELTPMEVLDAYDRDSPMLIVNLAHGWTFFDNVEHEDILLEPVDGEEVYEVGHWLQVLMLEAVEQEDVLRIRDAMGEVGL